jgi:hypothetical protein
MMYRRRREADAEAELERLLQEVELTVSRSLARNNPEAMARWVEVPYLVSMRGGGQPGGPSDRILAQLRQARVRMLRAALVAQRRDGRRLAAPFWAEARAALRGIPGVAGVDNVLSEGQNSLRLNNLPRFRNFILRAAAYAREAIQRRAATLGVSVS